MWNVYFIAQFLVVHVAYFGWTFEPFHVATSAVTRFNWAEVASAVWNFHMIFIAGVTFKSIFVCVVMAIPYTLVLLWALRYAIIYVFVSYQLFCFVVIKFRQIRHERRVTLDNVVVVKIGAPGSGKSSSGLYEAVIMARKMWRELRWKYYCGKWRIRKPRDWDEVKFSYNFFRGRGSRARPVPCLLSNIPVMVDGRFTTFVSKEHLEQRARLPAHCVLFLDEVGAMVSVDTAKSRMGDNVLAQQNAVNTSDFFRLCRHFGNWRIICTEQDSNNIYIDVRRVVSKNEYMLSQRWVLKPYLFLAVFAPLRSVAVRNMWTCYAFAPPLIALEKVIRSIGFRKYRYLTENNTERVSGMQTGKRTFYLPSTLNFRYDERTFRNFYNAPAWQGLGECELTVFTNLVLDDTAVYTQMFLRSKR